MGRQSELSATATAFAAPFEVDLELSCRESLNSRARRYACDRSCSEHSSRATTLRGRVQLLAWYIETSRQGASTPCTPAAWQDEARCRIIAGTRPFNSEPIDLGIATAIDVGVLGVQPPGTPSYTVLNGGSSTSDLTSRTLWSVHHREIGQSPMRVAKTALQKAEGLSELGAHNAACDPIAPTCTAANKSVDCER